MIKRIYLYSFIFLPLIFTLSACQSGQDKPEETPVSGTIKILADESYKPILEAEESVFEALYKNAHVEIEYIPELKAIHHLLQDSIDMIFSGRPLNPEEQKHFSNKEQIINELHFATDGLAFLIHPRFNNSLISIDTLKSVLKGKFTTWHQVNKVWPAEEITIVFDQSNSANLQMTIERFGLNPKNIKIYAAGSNRAVAEYVKNNPAALGVIGAAWLSDEESPEAKKIRDGVLVVQLENNRGEAFSPYQSSLYYEDNPFSRKIYIIRRNRNVGLATGFSSFLLSQRGQRIVLKSGLLPATMPGREIIIEK